MMPHTRIHSLRAAAILLLSGALATIAVAQPSKLDAAWSVPIDHGLDWCDLLGDPPTCAIVCDRSNELRILNLRTGEPLTEGPLKVGQGTRFGGWNDGVAYVYDRYQVRAFSFPAKLDPTGDKKPPNCRELWTLGNWDGATSRESGDPENVARLTAAVATKRGVLVARSDGRVGEFDRERGKPIWRADIGSSGDVRIGLAGDSAMLIHRASGAAAVSTIDLTKSSPVPRPLQLGGSLPIWAEATEAGLIAAWPGRVVLRPMDGDMMTLADGLNGLRATTVGVLSRGAPPDDDRPAEPLKQPLLVLAEANGTIRAIAIDAKSGKPSVVWDRESGDNQIWTIVTPRDGIVLLGDDVGRIEARDGQTGALVARFEGKGSTRALALSASRTAAWGIRGRLATASVKAALELIRAPRSAPGAWKREAALAGEAVYDLKDAAGSPKRVLTPVGRVVVAEANAVRVFVLPE